LFRIIPEGNESFILRKPAELLLRGQSRTNESFVIAASPVNPDKRIQGEFSANTAFGDIPSRLFT
jgi:hypothetical protein